MDKIVGITPKLYQAKILSSVKYLNACGLFLGTGSGKTILSLLKFNELPCKNLLVLCPHKVVTQWIGVIKSHTESLLVVEPKPSYKAKRKWELIKEAVAYKKDYVAAVFSLESLKNIKQEEFDFIDNNWCIIVDESHKIKEMGTAKRPTLMTKRVLGLRDKTPYKLILTATPTQKAYGGYIDYYSQLYFLGYLDIDLKTFKAKYCIEKKMQLPGMPFPFKVVSGYKDSIEDIKRLLKLTCRYYTPKFVDGDPVHNKIELDRPLSYKNLLRNRVYKDLDLRNLSARRMAKKTMCSGTVAGHDVYHNLLKYEDNDIKSSWLKEFLSNNDSVIVVFYKYNVERDTIIKVCDELGKKYIVLDGAAKDKKDLVDNHEYDVVIGQFNACGESIDGLQFKSHVCVFYCIPESSVEYKQALGRINRVGQEYLPIYYYLVCKETIEESIWDMIQNKVEFNQSVLNDLQV